MEFFNSAVGVLQTLVIALGAGLGIWGAINFMEGSATTIRAQRARASSSLVGGGVALIGGTLAPPAFSTFWIMPKTNTTRRALSETGGRGKGGINF